MPLFWSSLSDTSVLPLKIILHGRKHGRLGRALGTQISYHWIRGQVSELSQILSWGYGLPSNSLLTLLHLILTEGDSGFKCYVKEVSLFLCPQMNPFFTPSQHCFSCFQYRGSKLLPRQLLLEKTVGLFCYISDSSLY